MIFSIYHTKLNQNAELAFTNDRVNNNDAKYFPVNNTFTNISCSYYLYRRVDTKDLKL